MKETGKLISCATIGSRNIKSIFNLLSHILKNILVSALTSRIGVFNSSCIADNGRTHLLSSENIQKGRTFSRIPSLTQDRLITNTLHTKCSFTTCLCQENQVCGFLSCLHRHYLCTVTIELVLCEANIHITYFWPDAILRN